jgi:hypothetical protein
MTPSVRSGQLDRGPISVVPALLLPTARRQDLGNSKTCIPLKEPQHRLQIVRRKSDVDAVIREQHLPSHREIEGQAPGSRSLHKASNAHW